MSCDNFGNCVPDRIQPGFQQQPGNDPLRQEAFHIANELRMNNPQMQAQAYGEIGQTLHNLPPMEARHFAHELREATQLQRVADPLQERPEIVNTPNGPMRTNNDILVLNDPFHGVVTKRVPAEQVMAAPPPIVQPGYAPGPGYPPPGYPVQNPAVTGLELGVGVAAGAAIGNAILGHRRY